MPVSGDQVYHRDRLQACFRGDRLDQRILRSLNPLRRQPLQSGLDLNTFFPTDLLHGFSPCPIERLAHPATLQPVHACVTPWRASRLSTGAERSGPLAVRASLIKNQGPLPPALQFFLFFQNAEIFICLILMHPQDDRQILQRARPPGYGL